MGEKNLALRLHLKELKKKKSVVVYSVHDMKLEK